jgi:hypothetical protein
MDSEDNPVCSCTQGFRGVQCEEETDKCSPNPCTNNGICHKNGTCMCTDNFTGDRCQISCSCTEGTMCRESLLTPGTAECIAVQKLIPPTSPPHLPDISDFPTPPSNVVPSLTTPSSMTTKTSSSAWHIDSFTLSATNTNSAPTSTKRPFTSTNVTTCELCQNAKTCLEIGHSFLCVCIPGYSGPFCEIPEERCSLKCSTSQSCRVKHDVNGVRGMFCACPPGMSGANCRQPSVANFVKTSVFLDQSPNMNVA